MNNDQMIDALLATFGFAQFSRLQARRAGLESALWVALAEGRAKFIRSLGVDLELFRMIA